MNKREYKKAVKALGTGLCVEFFNIGWSVKQIDREVMQQCINNVYAAMTDTLHGTNTVFPKRRKDFATQQEYLKAKRAFFRELFVNLSAAFSAVIDKTLKDFNAALPKATA